jgi:hypothetical protein
MGLIRPNFPPLDFKVAAPEVLVPVPFAFREGAFYRNDVLAEQDVD